MTISANSFPVRHFSDIIGNHIDLEEELQSFEPTREMFAYLNPSVHKEFTHVIANHGREDLIEELSECNAVWLFQGGSANLTNVDNYFHSARVVTKEVDLVHRFLGLEEKMMFGADGQFDCLQRALAGLYPSRGDIKPDNILKLIKEKHMLPFDEEEDEPMEEENNESLEEKFSLMSAPF